MKVRWLIAMGFAFGAAACAKQGGRAAPTATEPAPVRFERAPVPAQEEDFEVISGVGTLTSDQVLETVSPALGVLMACVQDHAQDAPWLGGDIELKWDIAPDGSVAAVVLRKSTLGSWPSEACILQHAAGLVFPKPKGGPAVVAVPVEMPAAKRPLVLDPLRVRGVLVPGAIKLEKACGLAKDLSATAYVGEKGQVLSVGFAGDAPIDPAWAECASVEISQWVLAANRGYVSKLEFSPAP